jgi:hypothetical protein
VKNERRLCMFFSKILSIRYAERIHKVFLKKL